MNIEDKTTKALAASLDFRKTRHEIISSNIANADTPNYKAKRISFEKALARALDIDSLNSMKTTSKKHLAVGGGGFKNISPEIYEDPNGIISEDGNTVDKEQEMVRMTENKVLYDSSVQLLNKKLGLLKYILNSERN